MRQLFALGVIGLGLLSLTGCQPVMSPVMGILSLDTKMGWVATTNANATKEGKACANTIMGLVATGDASIAAAKAAGGITEVSSVDVSSKSILGITAEFCTIVRGK